LLQGDAKTRDWIAEALRGAIDDVVMTHSARLTQEPQISSKIADRMEESLKGIEVNGYYFTVIATDMPDRGPRSLEHETGVDLYIAIRVRRPDILMETAKGLLVQGKMDAPPNAKEQQRLVDQCKKMVRRSSKGAYVWIYSANGAAAIPASEVVASPNVAGQTLASRNMGQHFGDVLDCVAGDEGLVNPSVFESAEGLNRMMRELAARSGIAINVQPG
jgi:hypothetical protein